MYVGEDRNNLDSFLLFWRVPRENNNSAGSPIPFWYTLNGLVSLLSIMEKFNARHWLSLASYFCAIDIGKQVLDPVEDRTEDKEILSHIRSECFSLGLRHSVDSLNRIISELEKTPPPSNIDFAHMIDELKRRIFDEVSSVLFLYVRAENVSYYEDPFLFGEEVERNFPSAQREIAEAGKCLALGRHTACVFHLMRVVEVGLRTLTYTLSAQVKKSKPTWNDFIVAIQNRIKPIPGKKNPWQKHEAFISGAATHIGNISRAWRNRLVHEISLFYDEEEAKEIFSHVRAFMRHLATKLQEGRKKIL